MDKKLTYQEQVNRENTLKLRNVLATLPNFTRDSAPLSQILPLRRGYPMYMTSVCFFTFYVIQIPIFKK